MRIDEFGEHPYPSPDLSTRDQSRFALFGFDPEFLAIYEGLINIHAVVYANIQHEAIIHPNSGLNSKIFSDTVFLHTKLAKIKNA